jgi:hypothetical protein
VLNDIVMKQFILLRPKTVKFYLLGLSSCVRASFYDRSKWSQFGSKPDL